MIDPNIANTGLMAITCALGLFKGTLWYICDSNVCTTCIDTSFTGGYQGIDLDVDQTY